MCVEAGFAENCPNAFFGGGVEGVDVLPDSSFEEERSLRNNRNVLSQRMQSHPQCVSSTNSIM